MFAPMLLLLLDIASSMRGGTSASYLSRTWPVKISAWHQTGPVHHAALATMGLKCPHISSNPVSRGGFDASDRLFALVDFLFLPPAARAGAASRRKVKAPSSKS